MKCVPENTGDGLVFCGQCGRVLECDVNGDMPKYCPKCNTKLDWKNWNQFSLTKSKRKIK